jgi:pyruvate formate lyase activating enzyme
MLCNSCSEIDIEDLMNNSSPEGYMFGNLECTQHDGDGIREVIFLKGCNLECKWCSNPESQHSYPEIMHFKNLCDKDGACKAACPNQAISIDTDGFPIFNRDICNHKCHDKKCIQECHENALVVKGATYSTASIINDLAKKNVFFKNSDPQGGITFSGGEPLLQPKFAKDLLEGLKKKHIPSVGLETCGFFAWNKVKKFINEFDFIYYDIKITDEALHKEYTGSSNKLIIENLEKTVAKVGAKKITLSLIIVPTVNDNEDHIHSVIELCQRLKIKNVRLLPYHSLGKGKYEALDRNYKMPELPDVTNATLIKFRNSFNQNGISCEIEGNRVINESEIIPKPIGNSCCTIL